MVKGLLAYQFWTEHSMQTQFLCVVTQLFLWQPAFPVWGAPSPF